MLAFAADENFDNRIILALLHRKPDLSIVRAQDVGLRGKDDPTVLSWAAQEGRILLTHDKRTLIKYAYDRVQAGDTMPGVIAIRRTVPIGVVIEDILLVVEATTEDEWEGLVMYLPLK